MLPDKKGHFNVFGGKFVPETLIYALDELECAYARFKNDKLFKKELNILLHEYAGRPSSLYFADKLSKYIGAKIYLKREDLIHTGAHKINNTLGQILLAIRMKKGRIIAETGAGQHGVATATVCAKFNLKCDIYMGQDDIERQNLNVFRMKLLGANVIPVVSGSKTLKDATSEAIRDWVTNVRTTHYIIGSVVGPHPYPMIVRDFQSVIGSETKLQIRKKESRFPDYLVACVGGGSNAIGLFYPFFKNKRVKFIGVEAAGSGIRTNKHSASLCFGSVGVLHGSKTMLLQDKYGQINNAHSIAAGLDYPGTGPEHAYYQSIGRAKYVTVNDKEAEEGFRMLSEMEGIIPALESAHAVYYLKRMKKYLKKKNLVVVCVSGRGDKDIDIVKKHLL